MRGDVDLEVVAAGEEGAGVGLVQRRRAVLCVLFVVLGVGDLIDGQTSQKNGVPPHALVEQHPLPVRFRHGGGQQRRCPLGLALVGLVVVVVGVVVAAGDGLEPALPLLAVGGQAVCGRGGGEGLKDEWGKGVKIRRRYFKNKQTNKQTNKVDDALPYKYCIVRE